MGVILVSPGNGSSGGNSHSHDNMAVLNALSLDSNNNLRLNGNLVGEEAIEVTLNMTFTGRDIAAKYLELPSDCDTSRALTLVLENLPLNRGVDWEIIAKVTVQPLEWKANKKWGRRAISG